MGDVAIRWSAPTRQLVRYLPITFRLDQQPEASLFLCDFFVQMLRKNIVYYILVYIVFFVLLTSEELFEKALTMFGLLLFFCITSTSNSDKKGQMFSLLAQLTLSYYF